MPKAKSRQSISMHRKVQIAETRKRSRANSTSAKNLAEKSEHVIVHFASGSMPKKEQTQNIAKPASSQRGDKVKVTTAKQAVRTNRAASGKKGSKVAKTRRDTKTNGSKDLMVVGGSMQPAGLLLPAKQSCRPLLSEKFTKATDRYSIDRNFNKKVSSLRPLKLSAKELKEQEIAKAIRATSRQMSRSKITVHKCPPMEFGFKKVILALTMSVVAVLGVVYLVDANSPDVSLKVAAMQNGINAVYPEYTPRGYILSDITSESGKVTLSFKNPETNMSYSLAEENIAVDDTTALSKYIDSTFGDNFTKVESQGIIIYIGNGNGAAWIDNGIFYKLRIYSGSLTRKQIVTIATTK